MKNYNQRNQALLIRDIISMYREYSADASAVEYLSNFVFNVSNIVEENNLIDGRLDWNVLFSFLDQKYQQLKTGSNTTSINESKIDELYEKSKDIIKSNEAEARHY